MWIKRTVLEMGGKDAIVVDEEADLDAAVEGVAARGIRIPGAEMFGVLARDRLRKDLRQVPREAGRAREENQSGLDRGSRRTTWAR